MIHLSLMAYGLHMLVFWSLCAAFGWLDSNPTKHSLTRWSHLPPIDWNHYKVAAQVCALNQLMMTLPFTLWSIELLTIGSFSDTGLFGLFMQLLGYALCEDVCFYATHRLLHSVSVLYEAIHKRHHQWVNSVAVATFDCHPLEHLFCNLVPLAVGPAVFGCSVVSLTVWMLMATVNGIMSHCGYRELNNESHDIHHKLRTKNFGVMGLADRLFGTYHVNE